MRLFEVGQAVLFRRTPSSPIWIEARYIGLYTIHYGQRPWHLVQVNADKYIVPLNRIKRLAMATAATKVPQGVRR